MPALCIRLRALRLRASVSLVGPLYSRSAFQADYDNHDDFPLQGKPLCTQNLLLKALNRILWPLKDRFLDTLEKHLIGRPAGKTVIAFNEKSFRSSFETRFRSSLGEIHSNRSLTCYLDTKRSSKTIIWCPPNLSIIMDRKKLTPVQPPGHRCVAVAYLSSESGRWLADAELR